MADRELLLNRADSAVLSRDYDLAARLYNTLLKDNPNDKTLLVRLGNLYVKSGKDNKALPFFQQANSQDPTDGDILLSLGGIYRRLEKYDESVNALNQALKAGADKVQVYYNQGFTYKFMGKYEEAIDCFETVITFNPSDVLAYNHMGTIYALLHDNAGAIQAFRMGLKIDSNHPILHLNLAKSLEADGNMEQAQREYETALRYKPGWAEASSDYSRFLVKEKKIKQAAELTKNAISLNGKNSKLHSQLGDILMEQSDYEGAAKSYRNALKLSPMDTISSCGLATALESLGENSEAAELMENSEPISADDIPLLKKYAEINLSANRFSQASKKIKMLFDADKNNPETLDVAGQYYICNDNEDKAENCYKRIEALNPNYNEHLSNASKRYRQIGKLDKAEQSINSYIAKVPNDSKAYSALASIDEALGKINEALGNYNKAIKADANNIEAKKSVQRLMESIAKDTEEEKVEEEPEVKEEIPETPAEAPVEEAAPVEEVPVTEEDDFDFDAFGKTPLIEDDDNLDFDDINDTVDEENESLVEDEEDPLKSIDLAGDFGSGSGNEEKSEPVIPETPSSPSPVPSEKEDWEPEMDLMPEPVSPEPKAAEKKPEHSNENPFGDDFPAFENEPLSGENPSLEPAASSPFEPASSVPEMDSGLMEKMQEVTNNAQRAISAADKAWYAAQQAADTAQSVSSSEEELSRKTKQIAQETAREAAENAVDEYKEKLEHLEHLAKEAARKAEKLQDLPDPDEYLEEVEKRLEAKAARAAKEAAEKAAQKVTEELNAAKVPEPVVEKEPEIVPEPIAEEIPEPVDEITEPEIAEDIPVPEIEEPEIVSEPIAEEIPEPVDFEEPVAEMEPEIVPEPIVEEISIPEVSEETVAAEPASVKPEKPKKISANEVFGNDENLITEVVYDDKDLSDAEKNVSEEDIYFAEEIFTPHKNENAGDETDPVSDVEEVDAEPVPESSEMISDAEPETTSTDFGEISIPGGDTILNASPDFDESMFEQELASVLNDDDSSAEETIPSVEEDRFVPIENHDDEIPSIENDSDSLQSHFGELELSDKDAGSEELKESGEKFSVDNIMNGMFEDDASALSEESVPVEETSEQNVDAVEQVDESVPEEKIAESENAATSEEEIPEPEFDVEEFKESEPAKETEIDFEEAAPETESVPEVDFSDETEKKPENDFASQLALFKNLRSLSEFLPEKKKEQFMQSKVRVSLDYLISRLEGKKGLLETIKEEKGKELENLNVPENQEELSPVELTKKVLDDLKAMSRNLPDANLGSALNNCAAEIESKL